MSSGLFTTSNLLIGAGALATAAAASGVLYTSIRKPAPDEKAAVAAAAFAQADEAAKNTDGASAENAGSATATEKSELESLCPEDMAGIAEKQGGLEACGTGRPPPVTNPLDGVWEVDSPGNPKIDGLIVYVNNQYGILHRGDPNQPSPAHGVWRLKGDANYRSNIFSVPITVAEDGSVGSRLGQFDYCNCGQVKWRVRPAGENTMIGEWRYDDQHGPAIWRRRSGKGIIRSVIISEAFINEQGEWVSERFGYRSRSGRVERRDPVICCESIWVTVLGDNFAGVHNLWVDPATHVELREGRWVCNNGETTGGGRWDHCGVGANPGDTVAGIQFKLNLWDGMKPGPINIWVDGQPIPIDIKLDGYPGEDKEKPQLMTLNAYDLQYNKIPALTEGEPFILEAVFDGEHPDFWITVELPLDGGAVPTGAENGATKQADPLQFRTVTLQRTADNKTFRSDRLAIQSAEAVNE